MTSHMKLGLYTWALAEIAGGDPHVFHGDYEGNIPCWSPRLYVPLVPLLWEYMPEESELWMGGREDKAPRLLEDRLHKSYYRHNGKNRSRHGPNSEHPLNRSTLAADYTILRLVIEWPWLDIGRPFK